MPFNDFDVENKKMCISKKWKKVYLDACIFHVLEKVLSEKWLIGCSLGTKSQLRTRKINPTSKERNQFGHNVVRCRRCILCV